jgi:hypothetical protein
LRWNFPSPVLSFALSSTEEVDWNHARESHEPADAWARKAEGRGFRRVYMKRRSTSYVWLVKRQVLGLTYAQIARENRVDRLTVLHAVQDTAARLGLQLREGRRGRPPSRRRSA